MSREIIEMDVWEKIIHKGLKYVIEFSQFDDMDPLYTFKVVGDKTTSSIIPREWETMVKALLKDLANEKSKVQSLKAAIKELKI